MRRRFAVFLTFCLLAVIASGAVQTTLRHTASIPEYVHTRAGIGVGVMCFALSVWCLLDRYLLLRWLGLLVALSTGIEATSGAVLIHACFAPVLFTAVAAIAVYRPVRPVSAPAGKLSLRWLVLCLPPLVFLQIASGAAARHEVFGVIPHIGAALPLAGMILLASVSLLRRYPDYRPLRSLAIASIAIVLVQVPLGLAVFALRFLPVNSSPALAVAAAAHVSLGALLFAASALLALQYRRSLA